MTQLTLRHYAMAAAGIAMLALVSCNEPNAADKASQKADQFLNSAYVPHNNIEYNNYNDRQKVADDPTTILWCTAYPTSPNAKPFTVPIVGKLTSSGKRLAGVADPGPDGMTGSSVEYRYGFTPAHVYADFTGLETFCTTQPTVYQATSTTIVLKVDPTLGAAATAAQQALKQGQQSNGTISGSAGLSAEQILEQQVTTLASPKP